MHNLGEQPSENTSHLSLVLRGRGEEQGRAGRKGECFLPLVLAGVFPGEEGSEGAGGDEEGELGPAAGDLEEDAPAAEETAGGDAAAAVHGVAGGEVGAEKGGADAGAGEAYAVIEEGDEGAEEGGGAEGVEQGALEAADRRAAELEGEVEGQVGGGGPGKGAEEAAEGVALARGPAAHVDELAGEGDGLGGVAPLDGEVEIGAHGAEEVGAASVLAVAEAALLAEAEGLDEAVVDGGGGGDPFPVGAGELGGVVEPGPHDDGAREGEDGGVGDAADKGV